MPDAAHIAALTTSRADFAHLLSPLRHLRGLPDTRVSLIATGAHLSAEFGHTVEGIKDAGFTVDERIESLLSSDTDTGMAKTIGVATLGLADTLSRLRPDLLLLIADRYEMLAPAAAALALRIPLAHIEGGEVSEGAIDDAVRNALTKMSHVHFVPTSAARERVLALGEEDWRVHTVGAPSLDLLRGITLPERDDLASALEFDLAGDVCVVAHHPLTLHAETLTEVDALFDALSDCAQPLAFCFPNADAGSRALIARAREFCQSRARARVFVNLAPVQYFALLTHAHLMVGNSSSGIMETPSFGLPTVNVGDRQRGRTRAANVIDCAADAGAIVAAMSRAASTAFRDTLAGMANPYGDGHAGERIAQVLCETDFTRLLHKRALDVAALPNGSGYGFIQRAPR